MGSNARIMQGHWIASYNKRVGKRRKSSFLRNVFSGNSNNIVEKAKKGNAVHTSTGRIVIPIEEEN